MKVFFKSGNSTYISEVEANILKNSLIIDGLAKFQIFTRPDTDKPYKFINIQQVEYITEEENE